MVVSTFGVNTLCYNRYFNTCSDLLACTRSIKGETTSREAFPLSTLVHVATCTVVGATDVLSDSLGQASSNDYYRYDYSTSRSTMCYTQFCFAFLI